MMTLAVVLLSLVVLGVLTHFAPALRGGRTGYPSNIVRRRWQPRRFTIRAAHRAAPRTDRPRSRQPREFTPHGDATRACSMTS